MKLRILFEFIAICICALALSFTSALAESSTVDVRSGKNTAIDAFGTYASDTCYPMKAPKITFSKPKHGKITTSVRSDIINSGRCKGKRIKRVYVHYQSNRGYRGKDNVRITYRYSFYGNSGYFGRVSSRLSNVTVNVK